MGIRKIWNLEDWVCGKIVIWGNGRVGEWSATDPKSIKRENYVFMLKIVLYNK